MSEATTINIRFKLNFTAIFIAMVVLHLLLLTVKNINLSSDSSSSVAQSAGGPGKVFKLQDFQNVQKVPFIRTVGAKDSKNKTSTYLHKGEDPTVKTISKNLAKQGSGNGQSNIAREIKKDLSFKDLADKSPTPPKVAKAPEVKPQVIRPGARPGEIIPPKPKAIEAISLRGNQMHKFAQAESAMALSGDTRANPSLSNSDILVNLEVPEGVNPDELNKYELMFYSFQRRTAINYINSFFKHLDKFQRENPHKNFPLTDTKQVMTGRLTYDEKGNIKQIKMIRWTNVDQLQGFFEKVLKDMDTLHNPPTALWQKDGEFSIFFSLVING
mgnify:CR=1 FL=1